MLEVVLGASGAGQLFAREMGGKGVVVVSRGLNRGLQQGCGEVRACALYSIKSRFV